MTTETPAGREPMNAARRAWNADPSLDQWEAFDAGWKAHAMYHQGREDGRREVVGQVLPEGWSVSIQRGLPGVMWLELRGPQCSASDQCNPFDDVKVRIFEQFEAALVAALEIGDAENNA